MKQVVLGNCGEEIVNFSRFCVVYRLLNYFTITSPATTLFHGFMIFWPQTPLLGWLTHPTWSREFLRMQLSKYNSVNTITKISNLHYWPTCCKHLTDIDMCMHTYEHNLLIWYYLFNMWMYIISNIPKHLISQLWIWDHIQQI